MLIRRCSPLRSITALSALAECSFQPEAPMVSPTAALVEELPT